MNTYVLLTSAAAFALVSGVASAASLTNKDKDVAHVKVEMDGKTQEINLKQGETFDTKTSDAIFTIGKEKPFSSKGFTVLLIEGGKIDVEKKPVAAAPVKTDVKVDATVAPATKETEKK